MGKYLTLLPHPKSNFVASFHGFIKLFQFSLNLGLLVANCVYECSYDQLIKPPTMLGLSLCLYMLLCDFVSVVIGTTFETHRYFFFFYETHILGFSATMLYFLESSLEKERNLGEYIREDDDHSSLFLAIFPDHIHKIPWTIFALQTVVILFVCYSTNKKRHQTSIEITPVRKTSEEIEMVDLAAQAPEAAAAAEN